MNKYEPLYFFAKLFAENGDKAIIPADDNSSSGSASLDLGFPPRTQRPLNDGGVAPQRRDFNGIFYMLSAFCFFLQSGGIFTYKTTLDYDTPAVIFYDNKLWFCLKENGVNATGGIVEPGTNEEYWIPFINYLVSSFGDGGLGSDIGDIKMHYGAIAPKGWFACDGSAYDTQLYPLLYAKLNSDRLPDFRGLVPRGYDPTSVNDTDGASRQIGSMQKDAAINLTGRFACDDSTRYSGTTGVFEATAERAHYDLRSVSGGGLWMNFNAARVWGEEHIADEFRVKNFSILYCIKHD